MRWEASSRTATVLWGATSRICAKLYPSFLCSFHRIFSSGILLRIKWCNHTLVLIQLHLGRIADYATLFLKNWPCVISCPSGGVGKYGLCNTVNKQNTMEEWAKACIFSLPKKGNLGISKNYRGIILTAIAAKVYNARFLNRIQPAVLKTLWINQHGYRRNRSTISQTRTNHWMIKGVRAKILEAIHFIVDFSKAFAERKDGVNISSIWSSPKKLLPQYDAQQKHEGNSLLILLWHCPWRLAWLYINTIFVHK